MRINSYTYIIIEAWWLQATRTAQQTKPLKQFTIKTEDCWKDYLIIQSSLQLISKGKNI